MKIKDIIPILATAILLALAFPNASLWPLAYVALVPFLLGSRNKSYRRNFLGGTAAGFIFYTITFSWFASLTYWVGSIALLGVFFLVLFFSLLWGLVWVGKTYVEKTMPAALAPVLPSLWILMEYAENHLFTGFGWGSLGYTQWNNLRVAQLASFDSVYSVGFFIVLINVLIYQTIVNVRSPKRLIIPAAVAVLLGALVPLWGRSQMRKPDMSSSLKVGVIQPDFSLDVKWNREYSTHTLNVQRHLTEEVSADKPDLVIWPESSLYGYLINEQDRIAPIVQKNQIHLLMGSNHYEQVRDGNEDKIIYLNSAFLLDPSGRILGRYDKRHLAPFGEYVPMVNLIGFIGKVVPAISDFSPGSTLTNFEVKGRKFSVLICFENSFPHLVRDAAQGVDFLVQITNDGWFGRSAQPRQDLAIAAFRSIENGMTLIRAANTGISCFIDPWGRVSGIVRDSWGEDVFARGVSSETISAVPHDTFFKTYGDVWVGVCGAMAAVFFAVTIYRDRSRPRAAAEEVAKGKKRATLTGKRR
jgi:apolipoprotein N-acyltransferase